MEKGMFEILFVVLLFLVMWIYTKKWIKKRKKKREATERKAEREVEKWIGRIRRVMVIGRKYQKAERKRQKAERGYQRILKKITKVSPGRASLNTIMRRPGRTIKKEGTESPKTYPEIKYPRNIVNE